MDTPVDMGNNGAAEAMTNNDASGINEVSPVMCFTCAPASTVMRLIIFLVYFILSFVILANLGDRSNGCNVQHTYRTEFVSNIISNPVYSSSALTSKPPDSDLEIRFFNSEKRVQKISDTVIFPNIIHDPLRSAAFWAVHEKPTGSAAAGGLHVPNLGMQDGAYYFDSQTHQLSMNGIPPMGGVRDALTLLASSQVDRLRVHSGSLLPNYARCIVKDLPPDGDETTADVSKLAIWMSSISKLQNNSHLRGTCLLTGQQATVDLTSNFLTSVIPFSSVNLLFMLLVVVWISASFALFDLGGGPKFRNKTRKEVKDTAPRFDLDDAAMLVAILWNFVLLVMICHTPLRVSWNIPLNNAIMAAIALLSTIFVQWGWANTQMFNVDAHEEAARSALQIAAPELVVENPADSASDGAKAEDRQVANQEGGLQSKFDGFETNGFLATASAVRDFGVGYMKSSHQNRQHQYSSVSSGYSSPAVRHRHQGTRAGGAGFMQKYSNARINLQHMPNYSRMARLGSPFATYHYIHHLKVILLFLSPFSYFSSFHSFFSSSSPYLTRAFSGGYAQQFRAEHGIHHHQPLACSEHPCCHIAERPHRHGAVRDGVPGSFAPPGCAHHLPFSPGSQVQLEVQGKLPLEFVHVCHLHPARGVCHHPGLGPLHQAVLHFMDGRFLQSRWKLQCQCRFGDCISADFRGTCSLPCCVSCCKACLGTTL
jgi:hypothetical protein